MKKYLFRIISLIASFVLIWFLLRAIDISDLFARIATVDPIYYLLAFLFYLLGYIVRAYRVQVFFPQKKLAKYVVFISVQQVLNRVLPLRLGEVFFPVLLKKMLGIEYNEGIAKLMITRIMDLISLFFAFILVSLFVSRNFDSRIVILSSITLVVFCACLYALPWFVNRLGGLMSKSGSGKIQKARSFIQKLSVALSIPRSMYLKVFSLSVLDKLLNFIVAYFLITGLGMDISFIHIIAANTFSGLTEVLPINSIGSFGTTELGWAGALIYLGIEKALAIESGFGFNILSFSFTIILGILGYTLVTFYYKINIFQKSPVEEVVKGNSPAQKEYNS